jgi:hypothetical protein
MKKYGFYAKQGPQERALLICRLPRPLPRQGPHFRNVNALTLGPRVTQKWWAVGEGFLGMGSKYQLFQLRRMHQNVKKFPLQLRVFVSPLDFGHYNFLFPRFSLRVFRYPFDVFLESQQNTFS